MEKALAIVCGDDVLDIVIRPGTTAHEIIRQLNLPSEFCLSARDSVPFGPNEEVYGLVRNGQKLHTSAPVDLGRAGLR